MSCLTKVCSSNTLVTLYYKNTLLVKTLVANIRLKAKSDDRKLNTSILNVTLCKNKSFLSKTPYNLHV